MIKTKLNIKSESNRVISQLFEIVFLSFSAVEIFAEFKNDMSLIVMTKPFLLPILMLIYFIKSKDKSLLYLLALFFNWLANIMFISSEIKILVMASICFLLHRMIIVFKLFKDEKQLSILPIVLGCVPFLFLFLSLINLVYENINGFQFYLIICHAVLMTLVGGFSLASFVVKNTISSKILLISSLFFGVNVFILGIKFYYIDFSFLKPLSMIFFVLGHFVFCHFIILNENKNIN